MTRGERCLPVKRQPGNQYPSKPDGARVRIFNRWLLCFAIALGARSASAHPGHGVGGDPFSLSHYLTEPSHGMLGVLTIFAIALVATGWKLHRH